MVLLFKPIRSWRPLFTGHEGGILRGPALCKVKSVWVRLAYISSLHICITHVWTPLVKQIWVCMTLIWRYCVQYIVEIRSYNLFYPKITVSLLHVHAFVKSVFSRTVKTSYVYSLEWNYINRLCITVPSPNRYIMTL